MGRMVLIAIILAWSAFGFTSAALAETPVFRMELNKALEKSQSLSAARLGVLSAREGLITAHKSTEWSASLSVNGTQTEESLNGGSFVDSSATNVTASLHKTLYNGGLGDAREQVAALSLDIARAEVDIAKENTLLQAINAYTGLAFARSQAAISAANVARLEKHVRAARFQLEVGSITQTQLSSALAHLARAEATLIEADTNLAIAEATYDSLIGTPPAVLVLPAVPSPLPQSPVDAADLAEAQNPRHRIRFLHERIARRNLNVLYAQIKPSVGLTLSGRAYDSSGSIDHDERLTASLTFSMPLLPSPSVHASGRSAAASHQQALHNLSDSVRSTRLSAANASRLFASSLAVIRAYEAELFAASSVRDATVTEVSFGTRTLLDQLDAEQDVVNADLNLLSAQRNAVLAAYQLLRAVGEMTPLRLGLTDVRPAEDEQISSPITGLFPTLNYPE